MSHLEFASEGFDYTVKMTVDLSEIPVKKDVDPGKDDNKNNGTDDGKDDGKNDDKKDDNKGGLVINGGSTTTKKDNTTTKTGTTTSGVKVANRQCKDGRYPEHAFRGRWPLGWRSGGRYPGSYRKTHEERGKLKKC